MSMWLRKIKKASEGLVPISTTYFYLFIFIKDFNCKIILYPKMHYNRGSVISTENTEQIQVSPVSLTHFSTLKLNVLIVHANREDIDI